MSDKKTTGAPASTEGYPFHNATLSELIASQKADRAGRSVRTKWEEKHLTDIEPFVEGGDNAMPNNVLALVPDIADEVIQEDTINVLQTKFHEEWDLVMADGTDEEIAQWLGITVNNLRVKRHRAKKALSDFLTKQGFDLRQSNVKPTKRGTGIPGLWRQRENQEQREARLAFARGSRIAAKPENQQKIEDAKYEDEIRTGQRPSNATRAQSIAEVDAAKAAIDARVKANPGRYYWRRGR